MERIKGKQEEYTVLYSNCVELDFSPWEIPRCLRQEGTFFFAHREHKKMHWRHFLAILLLSGCTTGRAVETVEPIQPARPAVLGMNGILQPDRIEAGGSESCPFSRA
jgi:hypothetical protein